ncbi:MAG: H+-translocating transhydrogenase subunit alpha, partial [Blastocatellia bacterium]|nr:H+-translocating transhydrogenase subunit alpha [Blastocatellia bacterium]
MNIAVLRETAADEARVALMPDSVQKLVAAKASVTIESGAGLGAARTDDDYRGAGATVTDDRQAAITSADVLVTVNRPSQKDFQDMKAGGVVLGFLRPLDEPTELTPCLEAGLTTFAMELVPRITRAQSMDALSSMATVAGYKAVLLGANRIPRMFPLLMTAAGTVPPARVLILGAGVAGLQ